MWKFCARGDRAHALGCGRRAPRDAPAWQAPSRASSAEPRVAALAAAMACAFAPDETVITMSQSLCACAGNPLAT